MTSAQNNTVIMATKMDRINYVFQKLFKTLNIYYELYEMPMQKATQQCYNSTHLSQYTA